MHSRRETPQRPGDRGYPRLAAASDIAVDDSLDDPGCLIRRAFAGDPALGDDSEAVIIAWLALVCETVEAPSAARRLVRRLERGGPVEPKAHQKRLLDLLRRVAAHRRVG